MKALHLKPHLKERCKEPHRPHHSATCAGHAVQCICQAMSQLCRTMTVKPAGVNVTGDLRHRRM